MALQGTLDVVSVADVLRLLAATCKTGRLRLESEGAHAVVWLREGRITAVTDTAARQDVPVAELLFSFGLPGDGWMTFEIDDAAPDDGPALAAEALVAELEALSEEWEVLHEVVPSLGHRVGLVARLPRSEVTIDADLWPAVLAAALEPTVRDLGALFGLSEFDSLRAARDLVSTDLAEILPPSGRPLDGDPRDRADAPPAEVVGAHA